MKKSVNRAKGMVDIMKAKGFKRNLDALGRIVMPKEYRRVLNLENGEEVEMFLVDQGVLIRKPKEDSDFELEI